jgi:dTDP-4-amino-4,6-dideoxygalactose transaminase
MMQPTKVPFNRLESIHHDLALEISVAINRVLDSSSFILGKEVEAFERALADYCNCRFAIGVASGTDALLLGMRSLGIGPGDEVITSTFSFIASASTIALLRAKPVFVDINDSFNIDETQIESRITKKTKAILPVHLFGNPCNLAIIGKIAKESKLLVIEDAAQAIGARFNNIHVGTLGDLGALSFFPTKNLGALGDGGAILTNHRDVDHKTKILRHHGASKKYFHEVLGYNSRLDSLQAAVLSTKLNHLNTWIEQRRKAALYYVQLLKEVPIETPKEYEDRLHVYNQFTIQVPNNRNKLKAHLASLGIQTQVYYPRCLHLQPMFEYLRYKKGDFPLAEAASEQALSLPCFPGITQEEQQYVADGIKTFYGMGSL